MRGAEADAGQVRTAKWLFAAAMIAIASTVVGAASLPFVYFKLVSIPSSSMHPALLIGDIAIRSALAYHDERPKRGDVAVVSVAGSLRIARVIGLPRETIEIRDGVVVIDGTPVRKRRARDYVGPGPLVTTVSAPCYVETLPNGVSYAVLDTEPEGVLDNSRAVTIPERHYFLLGDNRDNSSDSRLPVEYAGLGLVPDMRFIGRIDRLLYSLHGTSMGRPRFAARIADLGCHS